MIDLSNKMRFLGMMEKNDTKERQKMTDVLEAKKTLNQVQSGVLKKSMSKPVMVVLPDQDRQGNIVVLMVERKRLQCPIKVILKCSVLTDLMSLTDPDQEEIPLPNFISRQIVLDLIEIVETDDTKECSHLVLSSIYYLLDFLVTLDFLGCSEVKMAVEELVRQRINDTNWKMIFDFAKDAIGLQTTAEDAIKYFSSRLVQNTDRTFVETTEQAALVARYDFSAGFFKIMLQASGVQPVFKLVLLRQWVESNAENKSEIISLVSAFPFEDMSEVLMNEALAEMGTWGLALSMEAMEEGVARVDLVKRKRQREWQALIWGI